ncbi:hypothetical protein V2J09_013211 [Rumex salicifolius]
MRCSATAMAVGDDQTGSGSRDTIFTTHHDQPGSRLTPNLFDGSNYVDCSHDIPMALSAKYKLGFIDGSCKKPEVDGVELEKWTRTNYMAVDLKNKLTDFLMGLNPCFDGISASPPGGSIGDVFESSALAARRQHGKKLSKEECKNIRCNSNNQFGALVKATRSDNGTEIVQGRYQSWFAQIKQTGGRPTEPLKQHELELCNELLLMTKQRNTVCGRSKIKECCQDIEDSQLLRYSRPDHPPSQHQNKHERLNFTIQSTWLSSYDMN